MGYSVIVKFRDLEDGEHIYNVGDVFPRDGAEISNERFLELASKENKLGIPLIKKDTEEPEKKKGRKKRAESNP